MVTLRHSNITSYVEFTQRLVDGFNGKDSYISFREMAQLRQTGTPEAYIAEFEKVAMQVTNILEHKLGMLFTKGLAEPPRGWVKAFKPTTLQDVVMKTLDMTDTVPKTKGPTKPYIPPKPQDNKSFWKDGTVKDRMDEETRRELRQKKLCFMCKDAWEPGHRCMGKGKAHYIEVLSDEEDDEETSDDQGETRDSPKEEQP